MRYDGCTAARVRREHVEDVDADHGACVSEGGADDEAALLHVLNLIDRDILRHLSKVGAHVALGSVPSRSKHIIHFTQRRLDLQHQRSPERMLPIRPPQ
jgi:hypothetical protein